MDARTKLLLRGLLDGERTFVGPGSVHIVLTSRCRHNCIGCPRYSPLLQDQGSSGKRKFHTLQGEQVVRLLRELSALGVKAVLFTGPGDPVLHPELGRILREAHACKLRLGLATPLTEADDELLELLVSLPVDELLLRAEGHSSVSYCTSHPNRTAETFRRLLGRLGRLVRERGTRPKLTLRQTLHRDNYREMAEYYQWAVRMGVDAVEFAPLESVPHFTERLHLSPEHRDSLVEAFRQLEEVFWATSGEERVDLVELPLLSRRLNEEGPFSGWYDRKAVSQLPCFAGWNFARVQSCGKVNPCTRGTALVMGDLASESFASVWSSDRYGEFRRRALREPKDSAYFNAVGCQSLCYEHQMNRDLQGLFRGLSPEMRKELEAEPPT